MEYKGLIPGTSYTLKGELREKTEEAPLLTEKAVSEINFTPETANGFVDVVFTLESENLGGRTAVAFEKLYRGETLVASHEDIDDEGQTVNFVQIRTLALADNGTHTRELTDETVTTIKDTVEFKNLIPGQTYIMHGDIHLQGKDKDGNLTDLGILAHADGTPVDTEVSFVPETADGSVELTFEIPTTGLKNNTVVVFETLLQDSHVIARHADITDEYQSVTFTAKEKLPVEKPPVTQPEKPNQVVETNDTPLNMLFVLLGGMITAGALSVIIRKRKRA